MSLFGILNTASTGLIAQQAAIEVTNENVTNMATPGYSRQTPIFETMPTTTTRGFALGDGVRISKVQRSYDDMLQTLLKNENSNNGQSTIEQANMQRIQQLFPDLTGSGLGEALQDFFDSWQDLSVNPQGVPERQTVISRGQLVAQQFQQISTYLRDVKTQANQSLTGITTDINDKLQQIAYLNIQIQQTEAIAGNANELRDQRELLVRDLSEKVGVNYKEQPNGNLTITLSSANPAVNGTVLVSGKTAGVFSFNQATGIIDLTDANANVINAIDLSSSKGEIGGTLQVRDVTVDGYLANLDELAYNIATQVNSIHTAGYDLNGTTVIDFFTPPAAMAGASASIAVAITDPNNVAAAAADPTTATGGKGDNQNALKMNDLKNQVTVGTLLGDLTISGYYDALVGSVGVGVQDTQRAKDQSDSVLTQLNNLRESQSGVSMNEEMTNLIKFQKAYEGSAKVINTATEMIDTVLGLIR